MFCCFELRKDIERRVAAGVVEIIADGLLPPTCENSLVGTRCCMNVFLEVVRVAFVKQRKNMF